jgi:hypothetical protein
MYKSMARTLAVLALLCGSSAFAQAPAGTLSSEEVRQTREELKALRERLAALEARLEALQSAAPAAPVPPLPAIEPVSPMPAPVATGGAASSKVFNPDIAVIGNFLGAVGKTPGSGEPSLELHEAEASFQAIVDPYARGDFFFAFHPEGVEVEEGYLTFPTLPGGFLMKVGKQRAAFGKINTSHDHVLPWTDRPLVTRNLVGGDEGISDSGISLSRLLPTRLLFLEATGEVYRGQNGVFSGERRGDLTYVGRLRGYQDVSESTNVDVGVSGAWGRVAASPDRNSRLLGVDATLRWRPLRRAIYRRFQARTELVWSRQALLLGPRDAFGFYVSSEYQLARRWFGGVRYDRSERADDPDLLDDGGSLILSYWPSEFSQLRGQYRRTHFGEGRTANELLFQLQFSIGAHGAHTF